MLRDDHYINDILINRAYMIVQDQPVDESDKGITGYQKCRTEQEYQDIFKKADLGVVASNVIQLPDGLNDCKIWVLSRK